MRTYLVVNRAPQHYQGGPEAMTAWNKWFDRLGEHLLDPGNPTFTSRVLGEPDPRGSLGGYTLLQAESLDEASALAADCPSLGDGGSVEIGEITPLNAGQTSPDAADDYTATLDVAAPAAAVYAALTTPAAISAWWHSTTVGDGEEGGQLTIRFADAEQDSLVVRVLRARPPAEVTWLVTQCPVVPDWVGTHPAFTITPTTPTTSQLRLRHHGLTPQLECFDTCRQGWDHFLPRLGEHAEHTASSNP